MEAIIFFIISLTFIIIEYKLKIINKKRIIQKNKSGMQEMIYYRELINDYSPLIYAKLLSKDISNYDVVTATLLYLQDIEAIEIDKNGVIYIKNNKNLSKSDSFFINKYPFLLENTGKNEKSYVFKILGKLVYEDMKTEGIIDTKDKHSNLANHINEVKKTNLVDYIFVMYCVVSSLYIMITSGNFSIRVENMLIFWITIFIISVINIIYTKKNFQLEELKTKKGHELTQKIKAQERFLKTFTLISEKTVNDQIMFKQYIRNGIFFDLKGKLDEDSYDYFQNILETCRRCFNNLIRVRATSALLINLYFGGTWALFLSGLPIYASTFLCAGLVLPTLYIFLTVIYQKK